MMWKPPTIFVWAAIVYISLSLRSSPSLLTVEYTEVRKELANQSQNAPTLSIAANRMPDAACDDSISSFEII